MIKVMVCLPAVPLHPVTLASHSIHSFGSVTKCCNLVVDKAQSCHASGKVTVDPVLRVTNLVLYPNIASVA